MFVEPKRLQIDVVTDSGGAVLRLSGDLDADSADLLVINGQQLVEQGSRELELDCQGVTFCDSFGLRAMMHLWTCVQPEGSVIVTRPSETLSRILDITGLADRFGLAREAS